jgi:RND family efflux transporter MFP subunit
MNLAHRLSTLRHQSERMDRNSRRRGLSKLRVLLILAIVGGVGGVGLWQFAPGEWAAVEQAPLVGEVTVGKFVHQIVERGDVQSSSNVDVRCEVQMRSGNSLGGVAILEIVPEGTVVDEGDFLVRLDDSTLQNDLTLQQLDTNASQAAVIQAETTVETARLTLQEYESGVFKQELEQLQSAKFVAEENYRRAVEYLKYSERLADKGYVTPIQLEADKFAVDKAKKELDVSNTKIDVLNGFTKQKMLKQLEASLRTAEAALQAQLENHSVETARLEKIKQQIARCVIKAPSAGQVVYANDVIPGRVDDGAPIQEGRLVRERQVIIRLPNPKRMQVVAKVNESRIDLVRPGMAAKVSIDALPGMELEGRVRRVSEYPLQQFTTLTAHIKEYATEIEIINPPVGIRPGMTAKAAVIVEQRENATQVPLQAVFERDGRYYCLTHGPAGVEARQLQLGPTNDKHVVVEQGLSGGEQVVVTPRLYADRVSLPTTGNFPPRALARRHAPAATEAEDTTVVQVEQPKRTVRRKVPTEAVTVEGEAPTSTAAGL